MTRANAEALAAWILAEAARVPFGEISIHITRHAGQTKFLEKTTRVKEQLESIGSTADSPMPGVKGAVSS